MKHLFGEMSSVKEFYEALNSALMPTPDDHARAVVLDIAETVGVDLSKNVEGDGVWSHANLLRIVRAVQQLQVRHDIAHGRYGSFHEFRR